ncbi:MAG: P-type conjugative transfer protein TrbJ [Alphaproteobacteria bacterium]
MIRKTFRAILVAAMLGLAAIPLVPLPTKADLPVFDATNYAESLIEAARLLQQINNQIQSLQNEATMLVNMARNLENLPLSTLNSITSSLNQIGSLMSQAQGIAFNVSATTSAFSQFYPQQYSAAVSTNQLVSDAHQRWQNSMNAFAQTLVLQAQIASNLQADTTSLSSLVTASQSSVGILQAHEATNQLLALSIKQQLQIQTLMATQYRAQALEQARNAESQEQARAALATFLGSGTAYSPQ